MYLLFNFLVTQATPASDASAATEAVTAAAQSSTGTGSMGMWGMIAYILFFVAIFYFFIIRPQKKKDKQLEEMQASIQTGDEVMTSSGFFGAVVDIQDDVAIVEFGTNKGVRIPVKKSEIYGNKTATKAETK